MLVSKTGIPKGIMGSNPIPSAKSKKGKSYWLSFLNIIKCIKNKRVSIDCDTSFDDIEKECKGFYNKIKCKDITKCSTNNSPFIYDHIGIDTKYSETLDWYGIFIITYSMFLY